MKWKPDKRTGAILLTLALLTLSVRVIDIDKPYETWDEITTYAVGLNAWYNIARLDFSPESWYTYEFAGSIHPPLVRYTYGLVNGAYLLAKSGPGLFHSNYQDAVKLMSESKTMVPGRLLSALFAVGTMLLLFSITRRYFGTRVAVLSAVLWALLPVTIAQTRIAALDSMLPFMFTLSIFLFLKALHGKKYYYLSLIAVGLAVTTKFNAITLFILLPLMYFAYKRSNPENPVAIRKKHLLLYPIVSVIILYLIWPRLWFDPIGAFMTNYSWWNELGNVSEIFLGSLDHPVYYLSTYVLVTTPVLILALLAVGTYVSLKLRKFEHVMILLWMVVPLFLYSFFHLRQAGPRYGIMSYPAIAAVAAIGIDWLAQKFSGRFPVEHTKRIVYGIIPAVVVAYLLVIAAFIHPYYLDYYNEAVGGPAGVYENKRFAIGQWGEGIDTATYWVNEHAPQNASVQLYVMPRHVIPPLRDDLQDLTPFIPKYLSGTENLNWYMTNVTPQADYLVENTFFRWYLNESFHNLIADDYTLIHSVDVQGAPLAWIYHRNSGNA